MSRDPFAPERVRSWLAGLGSTPYVEVQRAILPHSTPVRALAGVLVALSERDGQMHLLLTRRARHLRNHPGEMSFPGGRLDPTDADLRAAALREAHEEVALPPTHVQMYGALARVPTLTGFEIHAYAGEFDPGLALCASPDEIDTIHHISLHTLVSPGVHRTETHVMEGHAFDLHFYDCCGDPPIWGATAYIIHTLIQALGVDH